MKRLSRIEHIDTPATPARTASPKPRGVIGSGILVSAAARSRRSGEFKPEKNV
ncbi:MAG: hypothetical protein WBB34_20750 [Xanthobacteraceae bacterium]